MQLMKKTSGLLLVTAMLLQGNHQILHDNKRVSVCSAEDDASKIISYLSLFASAHEEYLRKGNAEPTIKCNKCGTKILDLGEFEGASWELL